MYKLIVIFVLVAYASCATKNVLLRPVKVLTQNAEQLREEVRYVPRPASTVSVDETEQNKNAFYHFESTINDQINDQTQQRSETREGLAVRGSYSYSDGYYKRTVHYEADENGYRVTGEEVEPLSGPQVNLEGTASVHTAAHGNDLTYTIQSIPTEEKGETSRIFHIKH